MDATNAIAPHLGVDIMEIGTLWLFLNLLFPIYSYFKNSIPYYVYIILIFVINSILSIIYGIFIAPEIGVVITTNIFVLISMGCINSAIQMKFITPNRGDTSGKTG